MRPLLASLKKLNNQGRSYRRINDTRPGEKSFLKAMNYEFAMNGFYKHQYLTAKSSHELVVGFVSVDSRVSLNPSAIMTCHVKEPMHVEFVENPHMDMAWVGCQLSYCPLHLTEVQNYAVCQQQLSCCFEVRR
ncbi:hypothetical protein TNCV_3099481 [Trichonephila clavipes]|nr:hypothetical protein TNCV_3099481 [Trichonephila clavipes]